MVPAGEKLMLIENLLLSGTVRDAKERAWLLPTGLQSGDHKTKHCDGGVWEHRAKSPVPDFGQRRFSTRKDI